MAREKLALLVVVLLLAVLSGSPASAREAPVVPAHHTLEARLTSSLGAAKEGEGGGLGDCWGALLELRSCTNEIVLFFLNGEAYLGQECCRAIRVLTHHCWPSMLTAVGFTAQEGDILSDYCGMGAAPPSPTATPPLPPPPAPAPAPLGSVPAGQTGVLVV